MCILNPPLLIHFFAFNAFISQVEPKNIKEALFEADWICAMKEELMQFERNNVWHLVPHPTDITVIGTRLVFRNKRDEEGNVIRNKVRLVVKGYNQIEGIDYDETYSLVARLEAIKLLIAYATHKGFKLYQMDVKIAFLNGYLTEKVFVEQTPGFEDISKPHHVYKILDYAQFTIDKKSTSGMAQFLGPC